MDNFRQPQILVIGIASLALLLVSVRAVDPQMQTEPTLDLDKELRHRLANLPDYSVFDNLSVKLDGGKVVLTGQVVHTRLKSDAEAAVKGVKGVTRVENDVRLLSNLSSDDQVRKAAYHAIYGDPGLSRYRYSAKPLIHIIVQRGNVTLEGAVYDESDATLAELRAKGVSNVSSVKNNLGIQGPPTP